MCREYCRQCANRELAYTLLKSDVTRRDHVDPRNVGSRFVNFFVNFIRRRHSLRITMKSTTLVCMRSIVTREPRNRDNRTSDVWASTAYCESEKL